MEIDVLVEAPAWDRAALAALAHAAGDAVFAELGLSPEPIGFSVLAAGDARVAELNGSFRSKPSPTNVLSWPSEERAADQPGEMPVLPEPKAGEDPLELGDIALAHGVIVAEAEAAGLPFEAHLTHLLVHGLLHLLGFDHIHDADADLMEGLEVRILARLGVADPYS